MAHRFFVEGTWGLSFERPVAYLAEYLDALLPLLHGRRASVAGERVTMNGDLALDAPPCPVFVAALGPRMLELAGRLTSGTITWMVGVKTIRELTAPVINEAAAVAGRDAPEVVVGLPVCVTDDEPVARARAAHGLRIYGDLPSYRARMLDREGLDGPGDVCVMGTEEQVAEQLAGYLRGWCHQRRSRAHRQPRRSGADPGLPDLPAHLTDSSPSLHSGSPRCMTLLDNQVD